MPPLLIRIVIVFNCLIHAHSDVVSDDYCDDEPITAEDLITYRGPELNAGLIERKHAFGRDRN